MSIMPTIIKQKGETRGRPKKNQVKTLSGDYRRTFTQHMCVTYGLSLMYVMEIWAPTKDQKRIGHSEGAFTVYQKVNDRYSYLTYNKDLQNWGFSLVLLDPELNRFCKTLIGSAPDFVFREMVLIIQQFIMLKQKNSAKFALNEIRKIYCSMQDEDPIKLDQKFKYLRFSKSALSQMKSEKWEDTISHKVRQLWPIFIDIYTYCIYCASEGVEVNKFLKPLFSDASNPEDTLIGQLSLFQIMNETERDEFQENFKKSQSQNLSFTPYSPKFLQRKEPKSPIMSQSINENKITAFNPTVISSSINVARKLVMPIIIKGGQLKEEEKSKRVDKKQSYLSITSILNFESNEKLKEQQKQAQQQIQFEPLIFTSKQSNQMVQENEEKININSLKRQNMNDKIEIQNENSSNNFNQINIKQKHVKSYIEQEDSIKKQNNSQISLKKQLKNDIQKQGTKIQFQIREKNIFSLIKSQETLQNKNDEFLQLKNKKNSKNNKSQCQTKINLASLLGRDYFAECIQKRFKNERNSQDNIVTGKSLEESKVSSKKQNNQRGGSKVSIEQEEYSLQDEDSHQHEISGCQVQKIDKQILGNGKPHQATGTSICNDENLRFDEFDLNKLKKSKQKLKKQNEQQFASSKPSKRIKLNEQI